MGIFNGLGVSDSSKIYWAAMYFVAEHRRIWIDLIREWVLLHFLGNRALIRCKVVIGLVLIWWDKFLRKEMIETNEWLGLKLTFGECSVEMWCDSYYLFQYYYFNGLELGFVMKMKKWSGWSSWTDGHGRSRKGQ